MSTKIYNGFRFRTDDLREILSRIQEFRSICSWMVEAKVAELLATNAVRDMDRWCSNPEPWVRDLPKHFADHLGKYEFRLPEELRDHLIAQAQPFLESKAREEAERIANEPPNFISEAWREIEERHRNIQKTGHRDPEVDFDFDIAILPIKDAILGIYYTEQDSLAYRWMAQSLVEPYGYWDNTDPEEGVSRRAWAKRKKDWDEALTLNGKHVPPSMSGLGADCVERFLPYPEIEEVVKRIPSFESRVASMAAEWVRDRKWRELFAAAGEPDRGHFHIFYEVQDWLETPEGQAALALETSRVEPLLAREVTPDHLRGKAFAKRTLRVMR